VKAYKAELAVFGASLLWGLNYCTVKIVLNYVPPMIAGTLRFLLAGLFILFILKRVEGTIKLSRTLLLRVLLAGIVGFGLQQVFFLYGSALVDATMGALITAFTTAVMTIVASLLMREKLTGIMLGGILIACAGMVMVVLGKGAMVALTAGSGLGILLLFIAGILNGLLPMLNKRTLERYSALRVTTWTIFAGAFTLFPLGAADVQNVHWTGLPWVVWGSLFFTAVGATVLTNLLWNYGLTKVGVVRLTIYSYLPSIFGVLLAALLLRETLSSLQWLGAVLTLGGVLLSQLKHLDLKKLLLKKIWERKEPVRQRAVNDIAI